VVNCGLPAVNKENWRQVARATAAHSTVTFNDTSSCAFAEQRWLRRLFSGAVIAGGPRHVNVEREQQQGLSLRASHDGYARAFGAIHTRFIALSPDGLALEGEDSFSPARDETFSVQQPDEYAIRFHLHPAVKANRLANGRGVILLLTDREVWSFSAHGETVEMEESVFLAGLDGPRRTLQIVIYGHARDRRVQRWSFRRSPPLPMAERPEQAEEPELPL
jgi:uncharacterized heparinase superfamily protein